MAKSPGRDRQTTPEGPHGWIQFKGTDLCMDVICVCGCRSHIDGEFVYYVRCPRCKRVYELDGHIKLVELTDDEARKVDWHESDSDEEDGDR